MIKYSKSSRTSRQLQDINIVNVTPEQDWIWSEVDFLQLTTSESHRKHQSVKFKHGLLINQSINQSISV